MYMPKCSAPRNSLSLLKLVVTDSLFSVSHNDRGHLRGWFGDHDFIMHTLGLLLLLRSGKETSLFEKTSDFALIFSHTSNTWEKDSTFWVQERSSKIKSRVGIPEFSNILSYLTNDFKNKSLGICVVILCPFS